MKDKTAPENKPSGLTSAIQGSYGLNPNDFNPDYSILSNSDSGNFNPRNFSGKNPEAAITATATLVFPAGIMAAVVAVAMVIALSAGVASAYPAQYIESGTAWGYTPGDISGLKDEYPADFQFYHISWIKIVPESDTDEWDVTSDYICILKTPYGKEIYIRPGRDVFYTPGDDEGGLFDDSGMGYYSVNISSLIAGAKADMIPWRGTWTVDYFFNQEDSKNAPDYAFVTNTTFTVYDDYTPTATPTPENIVRETAAATPEGFVPADSYTPEASVADSEAGNSGSGIEATATVSAGYTEMPDSAAGSNTTGSAENDNGIYIWVIAAVVLIIAVVVIIRIKSGRNRDDYYL
ncbi:hypothetical protein [Methanoplanus endosymbiosus]|uniref:Uncharacterized protein n=1 Tax=Methanoplanus endosymbiosus TaxID=33865 RepID=A0A9E7PN36_9EURY|nr:hypothetical protein [Methanoplanus endosymbiosus]UUX91931.1 hypothetical protein L6E24_11265 [Methanoplanus endosymbiosus]